MKLIKKLFTFTGEESDNVIIGKAALIAMVIFPFAYLLGHLFIQLLAYIVK